MQKILYNTQRERGVTTDEMNTLFFNQFGKIIATRLRDCLDLTMIDNEAIALGKFIRDQRLLVGLSISQLAEQSGLPEAKIVALEHGLIISSEIEATCLYTLAEILDIDIDDIALVLGVPEISALEAAKPHH